MKQLKRILYFFVILLFGLMSACSQELNSNDAPLLDQEGIIVEIKEHEDDMWNQILVVPNISEDDIDDKTTETLIEMAQENDGSYYSLEPGKYDELEVGITVIVYWNGDQNDSNPPQREAKKLM